jgi:hypothetical protein
LAFLVAAYSDKRMIDVLGLDERHRRVGAVDRTRRGVDQVLDAGVAAAFDHVQESGDVALHIDMRILGRIAHAGLRRQMHDAAEAFAREDRLHRGLIGDIDFLESKVRVALQHREARGLQAGIVVGVEIVESDDLIAALEQRACV